MAFVVQRYQYDYWQETVTNGPLVPHGWLKLYDDNQVTFNNGPPHGHWCLQSEKIMHASFAVGPDFQDVKTYTCCQIGFTDTWMRVTDVARERLVFICAPMECAPRQ